MVGRDELGHRSETVRRANLSAIVRELHDAGPSSRSDLVAHTGLTRSAIRALIGELVAGGLVTEERAVLDGTPGRPSPLVRPNPHGAVVLGLELSVDSLAAAAVGLGGEVLDRVRVDRPWGRSSVDDIATDLAGLATSVRDRLSPDDAVIGVGVAVVGVVRRSDGMVSMEAISWPGQGSVKPPAARPGTWNLCPGRRTRPRRVRPWHRRVRGRWPSRCQTPRPPASAMGQPGRSARRRAHAARG